VVSRAFTSICIAAAVVVSANTAHAGSLGNVSKVGKTTVQEGSIILKTPLSAKNRLKAEVNHWLYSSFKRSQRRAGGTVAAASLSSLTCCQC
jgi:hypothetical protein